MSESAAADRYSKDPRLCACSSHKLSDRSHYWTLKPKMENLNTGRINSLCFLMHFPNRVQSRLVCYWFPEQPTSNILLLPPASCCRRGKQQIQSIISPNISITIILTAIQLSFLCAWGNAHRLYYPSPLHSACQPASRAEQGRRNAGHNETDDNKAGDGEMAQTGWEDLNSPNG